MNQLGCITKSWTLPVQKCTDCITSLLQTYYNPVNFIVRRLNGETRK